MSPKDEPELLFANDAFYVAFSACDFIAMDDLWAMAAPVSCIHPGAPAILGRDDVMDSWKEILEMGQTQGFYCQDARAHIHGDTGWVTCFEIFGDGVLTATNIFVRENGAWKMTHHHAGPTNMRVTRSDQDPQRTN